MLSTVLGGGMSAPATSAYVGSMAGRPTCLGSSGPSVTDFSLPRGGQPATARGAADQVSVLGLAVVSSV